MMKGGHGQTNQLHDINWGALDHASRAPQLMSCNYSVCVCVCTRACVCVCVCVCYCIQWEWLGVVIVVSGSQPRAVNSIPTWALLL